MAVSSSRVKKFELDPEELDRRLAAALGDMQPDVLDEKLTSSIAPVAPGSIVQAKVDSVDETEGLQCEPLAMLGPA